MRREDLQIVVIENLKDSWADPDIQKLFCDLMQIKLDGYGQVYGNNVVSADKVDYFGTHLLVCKKGIRLKPLFGYKSITLDKCEEFNIKFPGLNLIESDGDPECLEELHKILSKTKELGHRVTFDYSWAQDPSIRHLRSPEVVEMFRDLIMVLVVNHHIDYKIEGMVGCGGVKVKTDLFLEKMGLKKISKKSLFSQKDLNGELAHIFHTEKFSQYAYSVALDYRELWENRIELSGQVSEINSSKLKIAS